LLDESGDGCACRHLLVCGEVDADRKGPHPGRRTAAADTAMLNVDHRFDAAVYRVQEIGAVVLKMKPEEIVSQQAVQEFFAPWKHAKHLAVGPRNVPELGHDQLGIPLFEHPRQKSEV